MNNMEMQNNFGKIIEELQKQKPVIHHITNYVTAEACADAAICAGASPVMADEPEEVEVITAGSDALVLNLGTINYNKMIAMERSAMTAKKKGIPVVLDPVGVMSSALRLNFALKLLKGGYVNIVRGNYDECRALADEKAAGHGVDGVLQAKRRQRNAEKNYRRRLHYHNIVRLLRCRYQRLYDRRCFRCGNYGAGC